MKNVVRRNFDASVDAYTTYERRTNRFTSLARLLAAEMSTRPDGRLGTVLDAGAGTGVSTRVFAETAADTIALDISREMLREIDSAARLQADFDHLPLSDQSVDGVAFTASLFLVPDPATAVREAARVLRPDGVVGAVAPLGWFCPDGTDVFEQFERESRSPSDTSTLQDALASDFSTTTGTWRFSTTAENIRLFHAIPAMAARLYPKLDTEQRVRQAHELLGALDGTFEQRWRWVIGVPE
ncbi:cyclopropane-fatty-acyl-phospholipid synthase [Haloarcula taiwanensis]|uniref:Cyclopropane-fatty-acyl-phospholipid synthase n=1 Tax=Haloarcula taiwanensis TaxID=1932004 RepID=A0A2H5A2L2_9EURY|nr:MULTISPECIES: class I SAM-dependent methyltransferase [Haloarcula]AUG48961.1 cyclopropane-fatty-acyl-phospholipid synthase [Haloarcula taiwanensis]RLM34754.1 class I SAM-dependent methyltransferase [Haloarcula sp. Atlit-120R]RLM44168.1 class I SAM-dependent methyltransferase [Haloarcula sp. Atlit-47R]RLM94915.1 class I SAM-dependent methyltransferase [Haloarcula sp. Atlit-7R]